MRGQTAGMLMKDPSEIAHVVEPDLLSRLGDAMVSLVEQLFGLADPIHCEVVPEAFPELLLKHPAEVALGIAQLIRGMAGGDVVGVIRLDKSKYLAAKTVISRVHAFGHQQLVFPQNAKKHQQTAMQQHLPVIGVSGAGAHGLSEALEEGFVLGMVGPDPGWHVVFALFQVTDETLLLEQRKIEGQAVSRKRQPIFDFYRMGSVGVDEDQLSGRNGVGGIADGDPHLAGFDVQQLKFLVVV